MINKAPANPGGITYYLCVHKACPARAATRLDDRGHIVLKWHALKPHSHAPNIPENDAQAVLHTYRDLARKNPDKPAKRTFEEVLATHGSTGINPSSDDCLKYLGNFTNHKNMYYRICEGNRPKLPKTVDDVGVEVLADLGQCLKTVLKSNPSQRAPRR